MRVLWFVSAAMPAVRDRFGVEDLGNRGVWVANVAAALAEREDVELAIVWASPLFDKQQEFSDNGTKYFCVPTGGKLELISNCLKDRPLLRQVWQGVTYGFRQSIRGPLNSCAAIIDRFEPDIVHVHGTESFYGLLAGRTGIPVVISLQGILQAVADAYWGSIPVVSRLRFPKEMLLHWKMRRNARREVSIIRQGKYFTGRTDWDRRMLAGINPSARYYSDGARLLRKEFYTGEWSLSDAVRYRLYTTATSRPYKGTDTLIEAVTILREKFPEIRLHIGGFFKDSGYGAYLRNRIRQLDLVEHVKMLGFVEADEIVAELKQAHAYLIGSFIENSPNSVAEAQLVGTPCLATNVGGTPSMVTDGESGLLYPAGDAGTLADLLENLFVNDELAERLSRGGREVARSRGSEKELVEALMDIYRRLESECP